MTFLYNLLHMKEQTKCQHINHTSKCYGDNIYNKIDNDKRLSLLQMVKEEGRSLKEAAKFLNINYSTAKTILRVFRIENRILKKSPYQKKPKRMRSFSEDLAKSSSNCNSVESTQLSEEFVKNSEEILTQFKYVISTLQSCIGEVINNEMLIKTIQSSMGNSQTQPQIQTPMGYNYGYNSLYYPNWQPNAGLNNTQ